MNAQEYTQLKETGYLAPDSVVIALARDYSDATVTGNIVRGTYFRVLLAHSQKALTDVLGDALKPEKETMLTVVKTTHDRLYKLILNAVTTPDIAAEDNLSDDERARRTLERNRRSNFARTAKSVLMAYANAGGELLLLKPEETTKEQLREWMKARAPLTPATPTSRLETQLEKAVRAMATEDRETALDFIEELHVRLLQIAARPMTDRTIQRGELTLHPESRAAH